jgi:hypothetical protein
MATESSSASGGMDIRQSQETWQSFVRFATWGTVTVVVIVILMAIFLA